MRQPKKEDLKFNKKETEYIRKKIDKSKSIKITINIDAESLKEIKTMSDKTGVPYQRLLNKLLHEGLSRKKSSNSRLDRLEREIKKIKELLAA